MNMKTLIPIIFGTLLISTQLSHAENEGVFDTQNNNISVYTGTFDVIDKEGDDKTTLLGMEHKNTDLFRDTFVGTITPITGAFITGKNSTYFYTVTIQYQILSVREPCRTFQFP